MSRNRSDGQTPEARGGPRSYQFSVRLEPGMLRRATMLYMWRRFRWIYLGGWAVAGLAATSYLSGDLGLLTRILGVLTLVLVLVLLAFPLAIWMRLNQTVEGYTKLTGGAPVLYQVDDDWLISQYANGSGEVRWSMFKGIIKSEEVWLLLMAGEDRFIPLPVDQVPEDALLFIEANTAAHGDGG